MRLPTKKTFFAITIVLVYYPIKFVSLELTYGEQEGDRHVSFLQMAKNEKKYYLQSAEGKYAWDESSVYDSHNAASSHPKYNATTVASFLRQLSASGYNPFVRPHYKQQPVVVYFSVYIPSITEISEKGMDFTVDFYALQAWEDYRVRWNSDREDSVNVFEENTMLVWQPDTYIVNAKHSVVHAVTKPNAFLEIEPHGFIQASSRAAVTVSCNMDFSRFPFDSQKCEILLEAYSYPDTEVLYVWRINKHSNDLPESEQYKKSATFGKNSSLINYVINGYRVYETHGLSHDGFNHSRLGIAVYFSRNSGFYLIQIYLPAALMTISSWISFWLPRRSAPARVTLCVTINLAMVTLNSQDLGLPKISYIKALDVYLMFCFFMAFLSLVEFAVVLYCTDSLIKLKARHLHFSLGSDVDDDVFEEILASGEQASSPTSPNSFNRRQRSGREILFAQCTPKTITNIEKASRFLFPVSFVIFNVVYWSLYYYHMKDHKTDKRVGFYTDIHE